MTDLIEIHDPQPGAVSSHRIEARTGWKTVAGLSIEKKADWWYVHSLYVKPESRGEGHSKDLLQYVESTYGDFRILSENDAFWSKMGYVKGADGYWSKPRRLKIRPRGRIG